MTRFQKKMAIVGAITAVLGMLVPVILKLIPDKSKSTYIPVGGMMINQTISGGDGTTTVSKTITIKRTN